MDILIYLTIVFILAYIIYIINNQEMFTNEEKLDGFKNIPSGIKINSGNDVDIPKIIHHICPTDFNKWHPKWLLCYESWLRYYPKPEYTHMHWDDAELDEFIEKEYPWFLKIFREYDGNIKRYDMSRVFLLHHYGGIYGDMDYMVYKNFFNELPKNIVSIPESPYKINEHIQNSLMISPPNKKFWLYVVDEAYDRKDINVFSATGPKLLTTIYFKYPDLVNVLSLDLYNPDVYDETSYDQNKIYSKHLLTTVWNNDT
jgi:hypothetical protein